MNCMNILDNISGRRGPRMLVIPFIDDKMIVLRWYNDDQLMYFKYTIDNYIKITEYDQDGTKKSEDYYTEKDRELYISMTCSEINHFKLRRYNVGDIITEISPGSRDNIEIHEMNYTINGKSYRYRQEFRKNTEQDTFRYMKDKIIRELDSKRINK